MTVLVVYPDAGSGATTVDGRVYYLDNNGVTFSTIRGASTGAAATTTGTTIQIIRFRADTNTNKYDILSRGFVTLDLSSLPVGATIDGVDLSFYLSSLTDSWSDSAVTDFHVALSTQASANNLVTTDYNNIQRTSYGTLATASWTASQYNDISFNATGEGYVGGQAGSIAKFSIQPAADINNNEPTWSASKDVLYVVVGADTAGTTQDPKLTVTYTEPVDASGMFLMF